MDAANLRTMERMAEAFNRHDVDAILECFDDQAVFETSHGLEPWGERFEGKASIRVAIENIFRTLSDIQFIEPVRWVVGDRGVAEWTCVATTPKGNRMKVRGCDLFVFRNSKVVRKDTYFKNVTRRAQ